MLIAKMMNWKMKNIKAVVLVIVIFLSLFYMIHTLVGNRDTMGDVRHMSQDDAKNILATSHDITFHGDQARAKGGELTEDDKAAMVETWREHMSDPVSLSWIIPVKENKVPKIVPDLLKIIHEYNLDKVSEVVIVNYYAGKLLTYEKLFQQQVLKFKKVRIWILDITQELMKASTTAAVTEGLIVNIGARYSHGRYVVPIHGTPSLPRSLFQWIGYQVDTVWETGSGVWWGGGGTTPKSKSFFGLLGIPKNIWYCMGGYDEVIRSPDFLHEFACRMSQYNFDIHYISDVKAPDIGNLLHMDKLKKIKYRFTNKAEWGFADVNIPTTMCTAGICKHLGKTQDIGWTKPTNLLPSYRGTPCSYFVDEYEECDFQTISEALTSRMQWGWEGQARELL